MKTRIVSVRIPAAQASGTFNIDLPTGFGVPKGFMVYAQDNFVQPDNFDSTTDFPCMSIGFGGSNIAGSGLTNACAWVSNQEASQNPLVTRASFANTVSIFTTNIAQTVRRQWQLTGFAQDTIIGTYQGVGTQQTPLDAVFTVFTGDDFTCAVGQQAVATSGTRTVVTTTFQPDAILFSHLRPATLTDGQIQLGAAVRAASTGGTEVTSQVSATWRNVDDGGGNSAVQTRISNTGSLNLASASTVLFQTMFGTGFAVTQSSANAHSIIFLAMTAGFGRTLDPSFAASTFQSPTGTATTSSTYGVGFKPCHVLGCFSHSSTLNGTNSTAANGCEAMSFFTANGLGEKNTTGTGTITSNTANTSVSGTGTSFLSQLGASDTLYNSNFQLVGVVSSITSNTALILQSNATTTVTNSTYEFFKSQQFSLSYGNVDNNANGNDAMRGRVSTNGIVSFTATTPAIQAVGDIQNFTGENGFTVSYTTLANGGRYGWFLAIRDEDFYFRRRVINT
jgi:hypothetical protein